MFRKNLKLKGNSIHGHLIWKAKVPTRTVNFDFFKRELCIMGRIPKHEVPYITVRVIILYSQVLGNLSGLTLWF